MNVRIEYENLDFPNIVMRKTLTINSSHELGDQIEQLKYELIQYESYQKGFRDGKARAIEDNK